MELEKLIQIISEVLSCDPDEITEETRFIEDLDADSLDIASIIMEIEQEFDIEVSDDAIEDVATVGDAVKLIRDAL